jgi:protein TonB
MKAYETKDFVTAQVGFMELAELGDGASQFNLGAMALRGEGMDKDLGKAAGWLRAAEQNGYAPDAGLLSRLEKVLTPAQRNAADSIIARYGREALAATIFPSDTGCTGLEAGRALAAVQPDYPPAARSLGLEGVVVLAFTVGTDGLASDVQVFGSVPEEYFDTEATNAVLRSRFRPTTYKGTPVPFRGQFRYAFSIKGGGGALWDMQAIQRLKAAAEAGHPGAQYIIGAVASLDGSLGIDREDARKMILSAAQGGDARAQYWMAEATSPNICFTNDRAQVWLEHAATGGHAAAQLALARRLLEAGGTKADTAPALLASIGITRDAHVLKHAVALAAGVAGVDYRDPALAMKLAEQLDDTPKSLDPQREEALAAAYAISGNFPRAEKVQSRALEKATTLSWNVSLVEERLTTYRAGRVWKGDLFIVPPATNVPPPKGKLATIERVP